MKCPETDAMLNSVRGPMTPRRFLSNLVHAYEFTQYRIDRVPLYELARCGLPAPSTQYSSSPTVSTEYSHLSVSSGS